MKTQKLGTTSLTIPRVAVGCMRINSMSQPDIRTFIETAMEGGANFFDHADIYGQGSCEELFAKSISMNPRVRETMILQSKCAIRPSMSYDFSKEYILSSVDGILQRLNTEYLDVLLLHRPDALMEPEEVAQAFDELESAGKVRHFGVSNHNPMQIELLNKWLNQPIVANQMQLSITNATMISQGIHVNMLDDRGINRDGSVLDYCRLKDITIQPWSPFQYGFFEGVFVDNPKFPELNRVLDTIAANHGVSKTTLTLAWILRHPAKMQPITGTTSQKRLKDCLAAPDVNLSREEWYQIYMAAGNILP